jgi:hypothetical protein
MRGHRSGQRSAPRSAGACWPNAFSNRRRKANVIPDCVASAYGEDLHLFALTNIQRRLGWVLTLDELDAKLAPPRRRVA